MRALVIQHDHLSPTGPIGERLSERGYELDHHLVVPAEHHDHPAHPTSFPDFTGYDLVLLLGAPWPVYDADLRAAWVDAELDQVRAADTAGVPVLGICFGGQLLAAAHGGEVRAGRELELGWQPVESSDERVPDGPWFQWHYDVWSVPPGATELARNQAASQAFVLRRNLAVQFHPELTAASLQGWLGNGGAAKAREVGVDPDALVAATSVEAADARRRAHLLVDNFLDRIARD